VSSAANRVHRGVLCYLRVVRLAVLFLSVLAIVGCSAFDASLIEGVSDVDAGPSELDAGEDPGTDAGPPEEPDAGPNLEGRQPPPRPPGMDTEGPEVVFGLRDVGLNQDSERWRDIGFNLDNLISVNPAPEVECLPPAFPDAQPLLDGNEGIDNAFGAELFPLVKVVLPELDETAVDSATSGLGVVILRVRGWNGTRNDPRVDVTITQSVDGAPSGGAEEPPEVRFEGREAIDVATDEMLPPPAWDGDDWFWVRDDTLFMDDLERPLVRDDNAYVADGMIVARLPDRVDITFSAESQGIRFRLTDAIAVAELSDDFQTLPRVTIGGRWSILDMLDTVAAVGVCEGDTEFTILSNQLNNIADIRSVPGSGGSGVSCDAMSLGVTFAGLRGRIAGVAPAAPLPNRCLEGDD